MYNRFTIYTILFKTVIQFTSSSSVVDSVQPSMCNARICRGIVFLHTWHAALGIFLNSVASDGSGVRSRSCCSGEMYKRVFPALETLRMNLPV